MRIFNFFLIKKRYIVLRKNTNRTVNVMLEYPHMTGLKRILPAFFSQKKKKTVDNEFSYIFDTKGVVFRPIMSGIFVFSIKFPITFQKSYFIFSFMQKLLSYKI